MSAIRDRREMRPTPYHLEGVNVHYLALAISRANIRETLAGVGWQASRTACVW